MIEKKLECLIKKFERILDLQTMSEFAVEMQKELSEKKFENDNVNLIVSVDGLKSVIDIVLTDELAREIIDFFLRYIIDLKIYHMSLDHIEEILKQYTEELKQYKNKPPYKGLYDE